MQYIKKKLLIAVAIAVFLVLNYVPLPSQSQGNPTCPTRPVTDSSNACASTAFVQNKFATGVTSVFGRTGAVVATLGDYTAALINYTQSGSHGVTRTSQAKLADFINAKDFGAACDGITDDGDALNFALNYASTLAPNSGGSVYLPSGCQSLVGQTVNVPARTCLIGAGYASSKIIGNFATGNIVVMTGDSPCLHDLSIGTLVNRTNGAALFFTNVSGNIEAHDFQIIGTHGTSQHFNGVEDQGATSGFVHDFTIINAVNDALRIDGGNVSTIQYNNFVAAWDGTRGGGHAGIGIYGGGGYFLSKGSALGYAFGMFVSAAGVVINDNIFTDMAFDHNVIGTELNASSGGNIGRMQFSNNQFTSSDLTNFNQVTSGGGVISGTYIVNSQANFSAGADGVALQDAGSTNFTWIGGLIGNNAGNGFKLFGVSTDIIITNARIGTGGSLAGNGGNGIVTPTAACDYIVITNNILRGNGSAGLNNNCTGTHQTTTGNLQ